MKHFQPNVSPGPHGTLYRGNFMDQTRRRITNAITALAEFAHKDWTLEGIAAAIVRADTALSGLSEMYDYLYAASEDRGTIGRRPEMPFPPKSARKNESPESAESASVEVEDMDLSVRAYNACCNAGWRTAGQIASALEFPAVKGCGKKTKAEIAAAVDRLGLSRLWT